MQLITHSGKFHADEVFGTALLSTIYPDAEIARVNNTRGQHFDDASIIFDIGAGKYDHHQRTLRRFHKDDKSLPFAAFGLLWYDFARDYIKQIIPDELSEEDIAAIAEKVEYTLVATIDATDNGVNKDPEHFDVTSAIADLSHNHENFEDAVALARIILTNRVRRAYETVKSQKIVTDTMIRVSDHVVELPIAGSWKFLVDEMPELYYVVYPSPRGGYNVQAAPLSKTAVRVRKPIPKEFEDRDDIKFVHNSGFLAVAMTREAALDLAQTLSE